MKVIIVGGVAGGASAAARLRRLNEEAEITIYEKSGYVSYANCGLPYYIGDVIKDKNELTLQSKESFKDRFNIDVHLNHEVISINRVNKTVRVKDLKNNKEFDDAYDKLILSMGARPIKPALNGIHSRKIYTLRNVEDTFKLKNAMKDAKSVLVVGGGFIGVEVAENLRHLDKEVTIVDKSPQVLGQFDADMISFVEKELKDNGIQLSLGSGVEGFEDKDEKIVTFFDNREPITTDKVVLAIGVTPDTSLAKEAGLELGIRNTIAVNEYLETSDKNIYAVGDAISIKNLVTKMSANIALAGPANKQGRIAADNIMNKKHVYKGSIASSILKVFDLTAASTGINERMAGLNHIAYEKIIISPASHATYYPGGRVMTIKALFEKETNRILGAQIIGEEGVDKRIDVLATAIYSGLTITDLKELDLAYAPPYASAKDPVNILGFVGENVADGVVKHFFVEDVENLQNRNDVVLLDTRTADEYKKGHAKGFELNIPVDELREHLDLLDKSKKIYVMCQSGLRSYIASRILTEKGYDAYNFAGGYRYYESVVNNDFDKHTRSDCGII